MQRESTVQRLVRCLRAGTLPALFAMVLLGPPATLAGHKHEQLAQPAQGIREPPRMSGISLDRAISMAEQRYNARVVRTEESNVNGRRVYVLRLLSQEGRVWKVRIDAETGGEM